MWGGGVDPRNDTAKVTFTLDNNSNGFEKSYIVVKYGESSTSFNRSGSLNVNKGDQITVNIYEYKGPWARYLNYFGMKVGDGKEYSIGLGNLDGSDKNDWQTYTFTIEDDTEFTLQFDMSGRYNFDVKITNLSDDVDVKLLNGITFKKDTFAPYGHKVYSSDTWFRMEFDAGGKIPVIDYVRYGLDPSYDGFREIGDGYFETKMTNTMSEITIDFIDPKDLVSIPEEEFYVGDSTRMTMNSALASTIEYGDQQASEASLSWKSSDESVATVDRWGKVSFQDAGNCSITVTLTYDYLFTFEKSYSYSYPIEVQEKMYSITVNGADNGSVSSSHESATAGTQIELTVNPDSGYILDSITFNSGLEYTQDGNTITFNMPAEDVTITPSFVEAEHTVTFYNGDSVHHTASVSHGDYLTFPSDPTKESDVDTDYTFVEWRDSAGTPVSEQTRVLDDMELQAFYTESDRLYHIEFVVEGAVVWEGDLRYGDEITAPSAPSKEGYEFVGWQGYTPGMTVTTDMTFGAIYQSILEPEIPDWGSDDDDWVPPYIPQQQGDDDDDLWLFVVLGSVALCLFLIFARYERRE